MKIFRRLRQNLLKKERIRKYIFYAIGEIVLVVVGILLALQINNWNEDRKREVLKENYLQSLKSDLQEDLSALRERLEYEQKSISQLDKYQMRLSNTTSSEDTLIFIARYEFEPYIYPNFSFSNSTYSALIATGDIDLFNTSFYERLNDLNKFQKEANQTMEWSAQLYQTYIGAYSTNYPMNLDDATIQKGPLEEKIWENIEFTELAAEFNGVTGLKLNHHRVAKSRITRLLNKTEKVLEEVENYEASL